jgi:hypothetical protein
LAEKRSLVENEKGLIAKLNNVLQQIGYRVEPTHRMTTTAAENGRRKSPGHREIRNQPDRHSTEQGQRRTGRPPLRKVA